jgi:GDPmannose 4,6-dehydratase
MTTRKNVLITGITGQDGSLLARSLLKDGFQVSGTFRRGYGENLWRLKEMQIQEKLELYEYEIGSSHADIAKILSKNFSYIFHLAGDSYTQDSFRHPFKTISTNLMGCLEVIEGAKLYSPNSKIFIACSSEIFGNQLTDIMLVDEKSSRYPINPYGVSQSAILDLCRLYRSQNKQFISVGILFNHESEFRSPQFLTRKISIGLASIKMGSNKTIQIGNLNASRDWGSAEEYVEVFRKMLLMSTPDDYIIANGNSTSVRDIILISGLSMGFKPEFVGEGLSEVCIDRLTGKKLVEVSSSFLRKNETPCLIGNTNKIRNKIGWSADVPISTVIEKICITELKRVQGKY